MTYKSIVVHVDDNAGVEGRIRLAAHLAHECHGCLIGVAPASPTPIAAVQARGAQVIAIGVDGPDAARNAVREKIFTLAAASFGIETQWRAVNEFGASGLARAAALGDLIVCGAPQKGAGVEVPVGDVIMQAGRPVLVVPPGIDTLSRGRALFAWKNTRESRRALADAVPMLARFASVVLVHVVEGHHDADVLAEPAAFLDHHGIAAEQVTLQTAGRSAAESLLGFARERSADLVALGAFGHSRAREWIFGGVTADFLAACPVPCLFSR